MIDSSQLTFSVLSLLALTSSRESALHASRYTAAMCPRRVATNLPVRPSHTRTELSHAALAAHRPSGLNATWEICRWCPVSRVRGFSFPPRSAAADDASEDAVRDGNSDHRKSVWSSEPEIRSSPAVDTSVLYRARASD